MILDSSILRFLDGIPSQRMDGYEYEEVISCGGLNNQRRRWMEEKRAGWLAFFFLSGYPIISITSTQLAFRAVVSFRSSSGRLVFGAGLHFAFSILIRD